MSRPRTPIICPGCGAEMERKTGKTHNSSDRDTWHICPSCGGFGRMRELRTVKRDWIEWQAPLKTRAPT